MVEMGKVKRKGIAREAKQGRTKHFPSTLRRNSDSQAVNEQREVVWENWRKDTEMGVQLYWNDFSLMHKD